MAGHFARRCGAVSRQGLAVGLAAVLVLTWTYAAHAPPLAQRAIAISVSPTTRPLAHPESSSNVASGSLRSGEARRNELLHLVQPSRHALPAMRPTTGPVIRGMYTGAAKSHIIWMEVTAYCPCTICCGPGARGITASGKRVEDNGGHFVAADPGLFPFGARLSIPGYANGQVVEVLDHGSAIIGHKLDVFFPTHPQAAEWGRKWLPVRVEK